MFGNFVENLGLKEGFAEFKEQLNKEHGERTCRTVGLGPAVQTCRMPRQRLPTPSLPRSGLCAVVDIRAGFCA